MFILTPGLVSQALSLLESSLEPFAVKMYHSGYTGGDRQKLEADSDELIVAALGSPEGGGPHAVLDQSPLSGSRL
ncbi:hypothetical protein F7725_024320 [Dissostichus mawsoni]|uniref:Uncharacterized protein n=1 Tax=Dissostichus mawsoni TaxID=36200 RepID=A0A7J5Y0K5_DISMA|nr:hypothetical protein F7725_024320 [Dissostichus mawsoni]